MPDAVTRRHLLAAAGVALPSSAALAQTTQPTAQPATQPDDLETAARLAGRRYTVAEKTLMRAGLERTAQILPLLRAREIAPNTDPALLFDPWLAPEPLAGTVLPVAVPAGESNIDPSNELSLAFAPVSELARLLRSGKVTSVQLTRLSLDRLIKHGPALRCVINLTKDLAMQQAQRADAELAAGTDRGPLHGIPYGAKDLLATKTYPTTFGVSPYREQVFEQDATVIRRLEEAGAVLVAKLSLGELAMGDVWFGGTTRNPWNPEEGSSGSSAGSCSATAAGLVPYAIGSETLGSIISPCVVCGTVGLRPTYGRVPRTGAMPLARTMDKLGPITRSVNDLVFILAAIAGPDGHDRTVRDARFQWPQPADAPLVVGYDKIAFDAVNRLQDKAVKTAYTKALDTCRELFGELKSIELPRDRLAWPVAMATVEVEAAESFTELTEADQLKELVQQDENSWPNTFRRASFFPAIDYVRAQRIRRQFMERVGEAMGNVDAMITVPRLGPNLVLTNLTGQPTCISRLAVVNGSPHQIEFVGQLYGEDRLLSAASRFETTIEARDVWPRERWA